MHIVQSMFAFTLKMRALKLFLMKDKHLDYHETNFEEKKIHSRTSDCFTYFVVVELFFFHYKQFQTLQKCFFFELKLVFSFNHMNDELTNRYFFYIDIYWNSLLFQQIEFEWVLHVEVHSVLRNLHSLLVVMQCNSFNYMKSNEIK